MATERQIEANRRNAQKSTGPKTAEGKERCRRNAMKHGMAAVELLPRQDEKALEGRLDLCVASLKPWDGWELLLVEMIARESLRMERCAREDSALRAEVADRAEAGWDVDRRLDAELLGQALKSRPAEVRLRLERTSHGCAWMADRWAGLLAAAEARGGWDDAERSRALDLLGVPPESRPAPAPDDPAALARREVDRLRAQEAALGQADDAGRDLAECGLGPDAEKAVRLVRRYERGCFRRMEWAVDQLRRRVQRPYPNPDYTRRGGRDSERDRDRPGPIPSGVPISPSFRAALAEGPVPEAPASVLAGGSPPAPAADDRTEPIVSEVPGDATLYVTGVSSAEPQSGAPASRADLAGDPGHPDDRTEPIDAGASGDRTEPIPAPADAVRRLASASSLSSAMPARGPANRRARRARLARARAA